MLEVIARLSILVITTQGMKVYPQITPQNTFLNLVYWEMLIDIIRDTGIGIYHFLVEEPVCCFLL